MSLNRPVDLLDLSGAVELPSAELGMLLEHASLTADSAVWETVTALLGDRTLKLLRRGSRREILDEALALELFLAGSSGRELTAREPLRTARWEALAELLGEAARKSDRAAVESLLLSYKGKGQALLEELARAGGPLPRARLRASLGIEESYISHLLRDLEEADLIVRYRPEGAKEVLVDLGPVGREVVDQSVLPLWIRRVVEVLEERQTFEPEFLARELLQLGAPSRLVADRMTAALARVTVLSVRAGEVREPAVSREAVLASGARRFIDEVESADPHFALVRSQRRNTPPVAWFGPIDTRVA